jgi:predicted nucleotidyltransferase
MIFNNSLDTILGQSSKVKILRFLIRSQAQLNGREIAKSIGLSHVKVHSALQDLSRSGLVSMRSSGSSILYWLNEDTFLVKDMLRPLFEKEEKLFDYIVDSILKASKSPGPLSIILFGSFAKNTASANSDIDLALVYSDQKNKVFIEKELAEAEKTITVLFGNRLAYIPIKVTEFIKRFKENDRFIREISQTGRVIYGRSIAELLNYGVKAH